MKATRITREQGAELDRDARDQAERLGRAMAQDSLDDDVLRAASVRFGGGPAPRPIEENGLRYHVAALGDVDVLTKALVDAYLRDIGVNALLTIESAAHWKGHRIVLAGTLTVDQAWSVLEHCCALRRQAIERRRGTIA